MSRLDGLVCLVTGSTGFAEAAALLSDGDIRRLVDDYVAAGATNGIRRRRISGRTTARTVLSTSTKEKSVASISTVRSRTT